jgi:hypothetical protein
VATDTPKFDWLIDEFSQLITQPPASFDNTSHTPSEVKAIADFLFTVYARLQKRK